MTAPRFIDLVRGRWAVSLQVWLILAVIMQLPYYARAQFRSHADPLVIVAFGLAGPLILGAVLLAADRTFLRHRRRSPVPLAAVVLTWIAAVSARAVFEVTINVQAFGAPLDVVLGRVIPASIAILIWAAVFTSFFALGDYYRGVSADVTASTLRLREAAMRQVHELGALRATLAISIETTVLPALRQMEDELDLLGDEPSQQELIRLADRAGGYSRQLVRDLSHEISDSIWTPMFEPALDDDGEERRRGFTDWREAPIDVGWTAAISLGTVIPLASSGYGWTVGAVLGIATVVWILVLAVVRALQPRLVERTGVPAFVVLVLANVLALGATVATILVIGSKPVFDASPLSGAVFLGFLPCVSLLTSSMLRRIMLLQRDSRALAEQNAELARLSAGLEASATRLRHQVADMLHGPVQGRLAAVALSLRLYADAQTQGRPHSATVTFGRCRTLLEQVNRDIDALWSGDPEAGGRLEERLAFLCERWAGLMHVEYRISPTALAIVERSPLMLERVSAAIEEAINNACSHGRARAVDIRVTASGDDAIEMTVTDDGQGPPATVVAGLGLRAVHAVGGRWELDRATSGGALLRISLPVHLSDAHGAGAAAAGLRT